jgi:hypothetical protein
VLGKFASLITSCSFGKYLKSPGFLLNHFCAPEPISLAVAHKFSSFGEEGDVNAAAPIYKAHTLYKNEHASVLMDTFVDYVVHRNYQNSYCSKNVIAKRPNLLLPGTWLIRRPKSQVLTARHQNVNS